MHFAILVLFSLKLIATASDAKDPKEQVIPVEQIKAALNAADRSFSHFEDFGHYDIETTFTLHPDVVLEDDDTVRRLTLDEPLPTLSHAIEGGSVKINYKPEPTHRHARNLGNVEDLTFCDNRCDGLTLLTGDTIFPKSGTVEIEGEDVGVYELCLECLEYKSVRRAGGAPCRPPRRRRAPSAATTRS